MALPGSFQWHFPETAAWAVFAYLKARTLSCQVVENTMPFQNYSATITTTERFDFLALRYIYDHFNKLKPPRTHDPKYSISCIVKLLASANSDGSNKVTYYRANNCGRYFARDNASLQSLLREVRNAIAHRIYDDVDIVNCQPSLLLQFCDRNGIVFPSLRKYCNERDAVLSELAPNDRAVAKEAVIKIMNGGGPGKQVRRTAWLAAFKKEMRIVLETIGRMPECAHYAKLADDARQRDTKQWDNRLGSILNYLLCDIENNVMMTMREFFESADVGRRVGVLVFDGCMVEKVPGDPVTPELLQAASRYVMMHTGYHVVIDVKEMTKEMCIVPECAYKGSYTPFLPIPHLPHTTLHCHDHDIGRSWKQYHKADSMNEYPADPLVCIRANMGAGKTKELGDRFFPKHLKNPRTSCIVITFNRQLAVKNYEDFGRFDFVNYLNCADSVYRHKRLIVCLDSLVKVDTLFQFVVIDEATSVLLHANSPFMETRMQQVMSVLKQLLLNAKHVYLLDACVDNSIVFNVAEWMTMHGKNRRTATWIRNTFIQPTNRVAHVYHYKTRAGSRQCDAIRIACLMRIKSALLEGKRVVVPTSSKKFAKYIVKAISKDLPDKVVMVYHRDNPNHGTKPAFAWLALDLLVYSPTIGPGISFEASHFDCLIAFFVNDPKWAPPVSTALQQLFRVRALVGGQMDIYVADSVTNPWVYRRGLEDIDKELDRSLTQTRGNLVSAAKVCGLSQLKRVLGEDGPSTYDRNTLSYAIVKGIVANQFKSACGYIDILTSTLREDYNIPCSITAFEPVMADVEEHAAWFKEVKRMVAIEDKIEFSKDLLIDSEEHDELSQRVNDLANPLTPYERAKMATYRFVHELWRMDPRKVDATFFNEYVMPHDTDKAYERYLQARRAWDAVNYTPDQNLEHYSARLLGNHDAISQYKAERETNYLRLVHGQKLLILVGGTDVAARLWRGDEVRVDTTTAAEAARTWVNDLNNKASYLGALKAFDIVGGNKNCRHDYSVISGVDDNKSVCEKRALLTRHIITKAFGIQWTKVGSKEPKASTYGIKRMTLPWPELQTCYNIRMLTLQTPVKTLGWGGLTDSEDDCEANAL